MFKPPTSPVSPSRAVPGKPALPPIVPGGVGARVLRDVWSGASEVLVKSPPGGGKTYLITQVVAHLVAGTDMSIAIATPTKAQALSLMRRLVDVVPPKSVMNGITSLPRSVLPAAILATGGSASPLVVVRTLASCTMTPPEVDLMIVDEAYQATYIDVDAASSGAQQVLLVGDPGQIGPVVTVDTSLWVGFKRPPHKPAPEVLENSGIVKSHHLRHTYRVGQETLGVIAPLYPFSFGSLRPDRWMTDGQDQVPEVSTLTIKSGATETEQMVACVDRLVQLSKTVSEQGEPPSLALVVSRNSQSNIASAMLRQHSVPSLVSATVGTADRLQGGEWDAVVALDPSAGGATSPHAMSLGRLCVMLSRHTRHLTWVQDGSWQDDSDFFGTQSPTHMRVRTALLAK